MFASWQDFYRSDLQSVYLPWIVPAAFFAYLLLRGRRDGGAVPAAAGFLHTYALVFAAETIVDPFATGPLSRWLGLGEPLATWWMIPFVLLGDFRVFLLVFFLADPTRRLAPVLRRAAVWTLIVPAFAWTSDSILALFFPGRPSQSIWILYELGFFVMALYLAGFWVPAAVEAKRAPLAAYLRGLVSYVGLYYALWVAADLVIVAGRDAGWALRVIPNQLYYSFWLPFAYGLFFSRRYDSTSRSTQASR